MRFSLFWDVTLLRLAVTDVSGQRTGPPSWTALLLEKGTNRLSQNIGNYQTTLRNIPEE